MGPGKSESTNVAADDGDVRIPGHIDWNAINWGQVDKTVRRLQVRIVKAQREGRYGKVKALSRILTRSFCGRAMAVRRVTENRGKKTAGVDGVLWNQPRSKADAIQGLDPGRYRAKPLRRVYIPKSNGKLRPLGIPTMRDRAMQALFLLALDPVAECRADTVSFGFRRKRSAADAVEQGFQVLSRRRSAHWVLEGDIKGCFDNISHDWMLKNVPMDKRILRQWLKAGYLEEGAFFDTDAGTPQGGIISPVLANMALDGLERLLFDTFMRRGRKQEKPAFGSRRLPQCPKVHLVRYADDFIITGESKDLLADEVMPLVRDFLSERGLTLSEEKTAITPIESGFDFLGFNFRKYNGKLLIKPSKKSVGRVLRKIRDIVRDNKAVPAHVLVDKLNPVLRGWANYHRHVISAETFKGIGHQVWRALWNWARRRHPRKGGRWVCKKYFTSRQGRNWVFFGKEPDGVVRYLYLIDTTSTSRHTSLKLDAHPYDPVWDVYFAIRDGKEMAGAIHLSFEVRMLWKRQQGICPHCRRPLGGINEWGAFRRDADSHHAVRRKDGGDDALDSLRLMHATCHRQHHALEPR